MKTTHLIVFDIDGTLTDSVQQHQKAFTETLFDIGVQELSASFKTFKNHTDSFIAKTIYENDQQKPFTKERRLAFEKGLYEKIQVENIYEIAGAKKLIDTLENTPGYGVCFATGSLRRPAQHKLNSADIHFNDKLLVASDMIYEREQIVAQAIEQAKDYYKVSSFKRIISVGDGLWDLITAQNLGLDFIGIGQTNEKVLIEQGAQTIYKDLNEFKIETNIK